MDYEQKYKEAVELMKDCVPDENGLVHVRPCDIFPELAESEDGRIRKKLLALIEWSKSYAASGITTDEAKEMTAWLEKQGEQNPWSEEDEAIYYGVIETEQYMLDVVNGIKKFNVGNISIKEECTRELNWLRTLKDRVLPQPKEEWSEEDEKMLERLTKWMKGDIGFLDENIQKYISWLKSLRPQNRQKPAHPHKEMETERWKEACKAACVDSNYRSHYGLTETRDDYFVDGVQWADENPKQKPAEWRITDEDMFRTAVWHIKNSISNGKPDTITKSDILDWFRTLKDRVQPQKEWSEEDESWLNDIISDAEQGACLDKQQIDWLKSLRPQSHWKPSEEQMDALRFVKKAKILDPDERESLDSLYQDLKKL